MLSLIHILIQEGEAIFHDDEMPSSDSLFEDIEEDLDEEQLELEVEDDLQR